MNTSRPRFERIEKQGGSFLLSKSMMEIGYGWIQPFGNALVAWKVTANQISWFSLVLGFLSGVFITLGSFGLAAALLILSGICDALDGMVARKTGEQSSFGEILDSSIDRYVEFFFLGGLVFYYRGQPRILLICLTALSGAFMVSYSTAKAEATGTSPPRGSMRKPERCFYLFLGAVLSSFSVFREYPMIAAVSLVAVFSHVSAIQRLRAIGLEK